MSIRTNMIYTLNIHSKWEVMNSSDLPFMEYLIDPVIPFPFPSPLIPFDLAGQTYSMPVRD